VTVKITTESDLLAAITRVVEQTLAELRVSPAQKVTIDPSYTSGNPKIQRPGDTSPGGSNKTQKVLMAYGRTRPKASAQAVAVPIGGELVLLGAIGDAPTIIDTLFGDGSDGDVTVSSGTTTLTRTTFYRNLTVSGTGILETAGYRVFIQNALVISGTGIIRNSGSDGVNTGASGAGGAAGYFRGGGAGGSAGFGAGNPGTSFTTGPCGGGSGGAGETGSAAGGAAGTVTAGELHYRHNGYQAAVSPFTINTSTGAVTILAGGAGGGGGGNSSGQAGGGGGGGGVVAIYAPSITVGSGCFIRANGGAGGTNANADGGGGGGGCVLLVYVDYSNSGTVQASGGGAGGSGASAGSAGNVITVALS
jgi:hypothetical protein